MIMKLNINENIEPFERVCSKGDSEHRMGRVDINGMFFKQTLCSHSHVMYDNNQFLSDVLHDFRMVTERQSTY